MTTAEQVGVIEEISDTFVQASGLHARAMVRATNRPESLQYQVDLRFAKTAKRVAFDRLAAESQRLAETIPDLASNLIGSAIRNANLEEQVASVLALDSIIAEAA